jgi:hypothetical protein
VEWLHKHLPEKKTVRAQSFFGKITCSFLWDKKENGGLMDISELGHTINYARHIVTLKKLTTRITRVTLKRNGNVSFNTVLPCPMPALQQGTPLWHPGELFCRSRLSPDLSPTGFHLFD